ncbi:unnamed protein product, partial [Strongylus vulgaris]
NRFYSECAAEPCIFHEGPHQVIYGIRNGIVHFRIIIRGVPQTASGWTGIGFGNGMVGNCDLKMFALSVLINNVMVHSSKMENGMVSVTFSRPVNSMEYPYDSSLLGCVPWKFYSFQFLIGLNRMGPHGELHHHMITPVHRTVCIDECRI